MGLVVKIALGIVLGFILLVAGCGLLVGASEDALNEELAEVQASVEQEVEAQIQAEEAEMASRVSWEWVEPPTCTDARCWQIRVTAQEDCTSGLYAELNLIGESGDVVDYTNASLGALAAGRSAVLTFETYEERIAAGEVTKVTCHG